MSNERIGLYEGMFLFPQSASANLQSAVNSLQEILKKCGTTTLTFRKWDERRLAYEIDGNKRGVYFLVYFTAPTDAISEIERRCNQSEELLRMMVTRANHIPSELIEANDGKDDLAAEIKLKSGQSGESTKSTRSAISKKEDAPAKQKAEIEKPAVEPDATETSEEAQEVAKETEEVTEEVSEA